MNQHSTEPEFIVQESAKTLLTGKQLVSFVQDLQVDIQVFYKELTKLEGFSGRIADDIRALALLVEDT